MIRDLGTVKPGTTLYIPFHTFDSNDPSASVTLTGLAVTDIEIYKDGGVTQRASDAGYALLDTDGIDFDGITGIHGISIDLANNTTANFYEAGSQYWVVISSVTVDAATINFVLATFTIGYPEAFLNTTIATLASQTSFTLEEGPADNDALNGCPCIIHDLASGVQIARGRISDYVGSTRTVTLSRDPGIFTMAVGDNFSVFVGQDDSVWDAILSGSTYNIVNSAGRRLRALQDLGVYEGGMVWIDTVNGTAGTTDFENGTVNNPVDTIADAETIRASVGLPGFHVYPASSITFAATQQDREFVGHNYTLALGGQDIGNTFIIGATVSGTFVDTTAVLEDCIVNAVTGAGITMRRCFFNDVAITANAAGNWYLNECRSRVAGTGSPNFDFGTVGNVNLNLRAYSGGIELERMATGDVASIEGNGNIVINANCTGGTLVIRGNFDLTDNAGGAVTITQTARPAARFDGVEGATFDTATDSLEALRNRGDVAWITGGGGSLTQVLNVSSLIPQAIDLANTKSYRFGLLLVNAVDDLPSTAEITPGTINIDRAAKGATSWTSVVSGAACSEAAGLIYYDEVFDTGTGYAEGDMIRVTFLSQSITADANTHEISDGTEGRTFYTGIIAATPGVNVVQISGDQGAADNLEADYDGTGYNKANSTIGTTTTNTDMRGTDGANTTTPPTAAAIRAEMDANSTRLSGIETDTQDIQSRIPAALSGGRMASDMEAISSSTTAADNLEQSALAIIPGATQAGTLSTTQCTTNLVGFADDDLINRVIAFNSGDANGCGATITDYASATGLIAFSGGIATVPAAGDTFVVV